MALGIGCPIGRAITVVIHWVAVAQWLRAPSLMSGHLPALPAWDGARACRGR
jgi:hypothetical protein